MASNLYRTLRFSTLTKAALELVASQASTRVIGSFTKSFFSFSSFINGSSALPGRVVEIGRSRQGSRSWNFALIYTLYAFHWTKALLPILFNIQPTVAHNNSTPSIEPLRLTLNHRHLGHELEGQPPWASDLFCVLPAATSNVETIHEENEHTRA